MCLHLVQNVISENTEMSVDAWSPALVLFVLLVHFFPCENFFYLWGSLQLCNFVGLEADVAFQYMDEMKKKKPN